MTLPLPGAGRPPAATPFPSVGAPHTMSPPTGRNQQGRPHTTPRVLRPAHDLVIIGEEITPWGQHRLLCRLTSAPRSDEAASVPADAVLVHPFDWPPCPEAPVPPALSHDRHSAPARGRYVWFDGGTEQWGHGIGAGIHVGPAPAVTGDGDPALGLQLWVPGYFSSGIGELVGLWLAIHFAPPACPSSSRTAGTR